MTLESEREELHLLIFNVGTVKVKDERKVMYPSAVVNTPLPAVNAAVIDAVEKAAAAGKPPAAIALQEYKFADSTIENGYGDTKGLLAMLNELDNLPGKRPPGSGELEPRWVVVRQFGTGVIRDLDPQRKLKKAAQDAVIFVDSWKFFITSASNDPAVLPHTEKKVPEMFRATGEAEKRLQDLGVDNKNNMRTVVKFADRWAGVHLVVRGEDGGPTDQQFLLISYHGRLRFQQQDEAVEQVEVLSEKEIVEDKGNIPEGARTAMSREFLLAVNRYASNRLGIGQKKVGSRYQAAQNASFTGIPALVAGDWNSTMNDAFLDHEFTASAKSNKLSMSGLALPDSLKVGTIRQKCAKYDYAMAANPESIAHDKARILEVAECIPILMDKPSRAFKSGESMSRFDHDPLLFTCWLKPKPSMPAQRIELFTPPPLPPTSEKPSMMAVNEAYSALMTALDSLKRVHESGEVEVFRRNEENIIELLSHVKTFNNKFENGSDPMDGVEFSIPAMERTPSPIDRKVIPRFDSPEESKTAASEEPKRALDFDVASKPRTNTEFKPAVVHCAYDFESLKKPGEAYNNRTVLVDRIRDMGKDLLGKPDNKETFYFTELNGNPWWTGPFVASRDQLRNLPVEELRTIYDDLRQYFVEPKVQEEEAVEERVYPIADEVNTARFDSSNEQADARPSEPQVEEKKEAKMEAVAPLPAAFRPQIVHCVGDLESLEIAGAQHNNKTVLRNLIRHMALGLLEIPRENSTVPYKELPGKEWWPEYGGGSYFTFMLHSKETLRTMYDGLRQFFV